MKIHPKYTIPSHLLIVTIAFLAIFLPPTSADANTIPNQGSWTTTLKPRDLDGNHTVDAYYDTQLNITWLRDWNMAAGTLYDTPYGFGPHPTSDGLMIWHDALAWASTLKIGGFDEWRLPTMIDTGAPGCDFSFSGGTDCGYNVLTTKGGNTFSELAHMWYSTLGNRSYCTPGDVTCSTPQAGWGLTNTGNFLNIQNDSYWTDLPYYSKLYGGDASWSFSTNGRQSPSDIYATFFSAVAVHNGDLGFAMDIPEPSSPLQFIFGLFTLCVLARHRMPMAISDKSKLCFDK